MTDKNGQNPSVTDAGQINTGSEPTEDEKIDTVARRILNKYRRAFEELAK